MSAHTDDGAVTLTYSGEVYNFSELRGELMRRGHRFQTRSDTEVVLHGYLEWDEACRRASQRNVRLRDLGCASGEARHDPGPNGRQAALLLRNR